jgi:hypothetical protein
VVCSRVPSMRSLAGLASTYAREKRRSISLRHAFERCLEHRMWSWWAWDGLAHEAVWVGRRVRRHKEEPWGRGGASETGRSDGLPRAVRESDEMDVQAVLAHPDVAALRFPGDQDLAAVFIRAFVDKGNDYPVDFDDAWCWLGYSTKGNALRKLKGGVFKEGVDCIQTAGIVIASNSNSPAADKNTEAGRPAEKYYLTERQNLPLQWPVEIGFRPRIASL